MTNTKILVLSVALVLTNVFCFAQGLPIKPTRTISFTTDEGTYMNVDVSPDGKTLAFDLLGDLYTVPATGGNATQLTRGIALNLRPVWSPDGKMIAYISDTSGAFHLNIIDRERTFHKILGLSDDAIDYREDALWTADGNYIAIGERAYGLTGEKISTGMSVQYPIRFSTNNRSIYGLDSNQIFKYDPDSNSKKAISPILNNPSGVVLSPDTRWLCYIADTNSTKSLLVMDLKTDSLHILVPALLGKDRRYITLGLNPHYCFSSDSKHLYIGNGGKIHRIDVESGADTVIPFSANVKAELGTFNYNTFRINNDPLKVKYTRSANASPDGKHLVFAALDRLYIMDLPNGKPHQLAPQPMGQFQPVYSPDGRWIAYVTWSDTAGGKVWRAPTAGGSPEQLTQLSAQYQQPAWSPDGKTIAVVRGAAKLGDRDDYGQGQLELISVTGKTETIIDDSVPLWNQLAFTVDGLRVIYTPKYRSGNNTSTAPTLVSKDLNGNNLTIIAVGARFTHFQQKSLSPDGRYIVFSAYEDLYLIPRSQLIEPTVISTENRQPIAIQFSKGVDPYWEKGGKVLTWSYGNKFYSVDPDKIISTAIKTEFRRKSLVDPEAAFFTNSVVPDHVDTIRLSAPKLYGQGTIALKNMRIITMQGDKVIEHGSIVIKDGRIIAIGQTRNVVIPSGAKAFDLTGTTVMPGMVDIHLHMRVPSYLFPQQSWMFLINLAYGVTTARDPSLSFDSFGYSELLESGQMTGPRLYTVGRSVKVDNGVMRLDNLEDARAVVGKRSELGGTVIKNYLPPTPRLTRQWLAIACREAGLNMTNEGWFDPILQLGMVKDGSTGVEHNPIWGDIYKDLITFLAESKTYFTPTLQVSSGTETGKGKDYFKYKYWHSPDNKLRHFAFSDSAGHPTFNGAESIEVIEHASPRDTVNPVFIAPTLISARIRALGGKIALGSHGNDEGIGPQNELWALQMGGISNMEALREATLTGAQALGLQQDIGSLEVGKIADLLILNSNPLEDIHNSREIRYVMKDGVLYDGNTLDMIWPNSIQLPEWKLKGKK